MGLLKPKTVTSVVRALGLIKRDFKNHLENIPGSPSFHQIKKRVLPKAKALPNSVYIVNVYFWNFLIIFLMYVETQNAGLLSY